MLNIDVSATGMFLWIFFNLAVININTMEDLILAKDHVKSKILYLAVKKIFLILLIPNNIETNIAHKNHQKLIFN